MCFSIFQCHQNLTNTVFKVADRPGTKPDWAGCSKEGSRGPKCNAMILDRILTSTLIREIGR